MIAIFNYKPYFNLISSKNMAFNLSKLVISSESPILNLRTTFLACLIISKTKTAEDAYTIAIIVPNIAPLIDPKYKTKQKKIKKIQTGVIKPKSTTLQVPKQSIVDFL